MSDCECEYPVNLQRARRVFAKATKVLEAVCVENGEFLRQDHDARVKAWPPGIWSDIGPYNNLLNVRGQYGSLSELAQRVTQLTLTRKEIGLMAHAERTDFAAFYAASVERLKANPPRAPWVDEPKVAAVKTETERKSGWRSALAAWRTFDAKRINGGRDIET